jgi:hypothetical protein
VRVPDLLSVDSSFVGQAGDASIPRLYDPIVEHRRTKMLQEAPIGPDPPAILRWLRTASSGRRLIVVSLGGSYFALVSFSP